MISSINVYMLFNMLMVRLLYIYIYIYIACYVFQKIVLHSFLMLYLH